MGSFPFCSFCYSSSENMKWKMPKINNFNFKLGVILSSVIKLCRSAVSYMGHESSFCLACPSHHICYPSISQLVAIVVIRLIIMELFLCFFFLLSFFFYHFYIYLHVYTLFVLPPPTSSPLLGRTCSALFSYFVEEKT
jgi:hypothetical protein